MHAKIDDAEWLMIVDALRCLGGSLAESAARATRAAVDARRHKLKDLAKERQLAAEEHTADADEVMALAERIHRSI